MRYSGPGARLAVVLAVLLSACADTVTVGDDLSRPRYAVGGEALLVCPGGDGGATEGEVGLPGGGVANGRNGLLLPHGAVPAATRFRVTVPASQYMEVNIKADGREGFSFGTLVQGSIDYSRCTDVPATALVVWKIDPATKALLKRMPSLDDRQNRRVLFETDSLSSYSIAH